MKYSTGFFLIGNNILAMHELINKLAFSLFKKNSLEECSIEEIAELANQYPYFSSAQLLLAAKKKQAAHPDFEKQLSTASLHINNPLWLDHLLNSKASNERIALEKKTPVEEVLEEPNNDELVLEKIHHEFIDASKKDEAATTPVQQTPGIAGAGEQPHVFEPYYTVDYFASQGIKNVIEEKPKDRFSQQLKSFTEWLKTIKQLPPQQVAAMSDARSEEKVVELATHSIEDRNIETETMAEVWIKQGQPEKAVAIYRKLSLLNPSKSSYFASLIENLKKP
jgi:hypothetical protein